MITKENNLDVLKEILERLNKERKVAVDTKPKGGIFSKSRSDRLYMIKEIDDDIKLVNSKIANIKINEADGMVKSSVIQSRLHLDAKRREFLAELENTEITLNNFEWMNSNENIAEYCDTLKSKIRIIKQKIQHIDTCIAGRGNKLKPSDRTDAHTTAYRLNTAFQANEINIKNALTMCNNNELDSISKISLIRLIELNNIALESLLSKSKDLSPIKCFYDALNALSNSHVHYDIMQYHGSVDILDQQHLLVVKDLILDHQVFIKSLMHEITTYAILNTLINCTGLISSVDEYYNKFNIIMKDVDKAIGNINKSKTEDLKVDDIKSLEKQIGLYEEMARGAKHDVERHEDHLLFLKSHLEILKVIGGN